MDLADSPVNKAAEYYPKLTAVGHGEPTFAAFYPNCHSVFGFYDSELTAKSGEGRYYLFGWYSDPAQDYLAEFIRTLPDDARTNAARRKALEDGFKWTLEVDEQHDFPKQMLCYACLFFGRQVDEKLDETVAIAVGNTGTEALSAYVADTLEGSKTIIEDNSGAGPFFSLEHRQRDIHPKNFSSPTRERFYRDARRLALDCPAGINRYVGGRRK
jgi:hypothetical protein